MNSSETAVSSRPARNPDDLASTQVQKVSQAARHCVSQAVALCNSSVAESNGNGSTALQTPRDADVVNFGADEENCQERSSATALGNENVLTTAGSHNQIFNIVNTYHNANHASSIQNETPAPMQVEDSAVPPQASYPHVHYNDQVLWCVAKNLTDQQRLKIKMLLRKEATTGIGISRKELENIQTNTDLINCLEDHNLLNVNNTWFLQFLAFCVRNKKIYKQVTEFMADRLIQEHPVCVYEPLEIKGSVGVQVQLKVAGDLERFTKMDIETFRQILAENCGNKVRYTNLTGINDGCVELTFHIPASCKDIVVEDAKRGAEWLVVNGIMKVTFIGDDQSVDLPKLESAAGIYHQSMMSESARLLIKILNDSPEDMAFPTSDSLVPDLLGATPHMQNFSSINWRLGGKPLLHWACELGKTDWVKFLIQHGADVNAKDEIGLSILHKVAFLDLVEVCEELLRFEEIDLTIMDEDGLKPMEYAQEAGHRDIVIRLAIAVSEERIAVSEERIAEESKEIAVSEERIAVSEERIAVKEEMIAIFKERIAEKSKKIAVSAERIEAVLEERKAENLKEITVSEERIAEKSKELQMSEQLIRGFMEEYLQEKGVYIESSTTSDEYKMHPSLKLQSEIGRNLSMIGDGFDRDLTLQEMIRRLDLTHREFDASMYREVAFRMFSDRGITWGGILTLVAFGGQMTVLSAKRGSSKVVRPMVETTVRYITDNYSKWIVENNGREGFLKYQQSEEEQPEKHLSSLAAAVASIAAWHEQSY